MARMVSRLEKRTFDSPDRRDSPFEKGTIEVVTLGGLTFQRESLEPGWRWSEHVKPVVNTSSCQKYHLKVILSGRQMIVMDDGTEAELGPGDIAVIPPGHDAWVVGDEPNVLLELAPLLDQT